MLHYVLGLLLLPQRDDSNDFVVELSDSLDAIVTTNSHPAIEAVDTCALVQGRETILVRPKAIPELRDRVLNPHAIVKLSYAKSLSNFIDRPVTLPEGIKEGFGFPLRLTRFPCEFSCPHPVGCAVIDHLICFPQMFDIWTRTIVVGINFLLCDIPCEECKVKVWVEPFTRHLFHIVRVERLHVVSLSSILQRGHI